MQQCGENRLVRVSSALLSASEMCFRHLYIPPVVSHSIIYLGKDRSDVSEEWIKWVFHGVRWSLNVSLFIFYPAEPEITTDHDNAKMHHLLLLLRLTVNFPPQKCVRNDTFFHVEIAEFRLCLTACVHTEMGRGWLLKTFSIVES